MDKTKLEDLVKVADFIDRMKKPPYNYGWGTAKNYLVVLGKLGECIQSLEIFMPTQNWWTRFKINYSGAMATCSRNLKMELAAKARDVSSSA
jgi:hypothetical protein